VERRITLVTGASQGIGRSLALALARDGQHVIALARSRKALESLDDAIQGVAGEPATLIPMDLKDGAAIDALAGVFLERFGRLDGLAGNAGILGTLSPTEMQSPARLAETMDVNFNANWRLIRALHPLLKASPAGRVLFVTSGAAVRPRAFWGAYAASKAALEAMAMSYADEVEKSTIRVNLFDPGPTRTAMRAAAMPGEDPLILPTADEVADTMLPYLGEACSLHATRTAFPRR
jgi:NAD(P)-dependent dehydrogenase (short-subunit alcohol dehydrogenase family)